jgi:hypothetical protein
MAVMAKEAWTDERLDDLNRKVDAGFKETREEFRAVRAELGGQLAAIHRTMLQLFAGMIVTLVLGFSGMIVTLLVQA